MGSVRVAARFVQEFKQLFNLIDSPLFDTAANGLVKASETSSISFRWEWADPIAVAFKYSGLLILYCGRYKAPVGAINEALKTIDTGPRRCAASALPHHLWTTSPTRQTLTSKKRTRNRPYIQKCPKMKRIAPFSGWTLMRLAEPYNKIWSIGF